VVILLFEFLPYVEEFLRGLRANAGQLVPPAARNARPGQREHGDIAIASASACGTRCSSALVLR
jgi:hypothetical protein